MGQVRRSRRTEAQRLEQLERWRLELDEHCAGHRPSGARFRWSRTDVDALLAELLHEREEFWTLEDLSALSDADRLVDERVSEMELAAGRVLAPALEVCDWNELEIEVAWDSATLRRMISRARTLPASWTPPALAQQALAGLEKTNPFVRSNELVAATSLLYQAQKKIRRTQRRLVWELVRVAETPKGHVARAARRSAAWVNECVFQVGESLWPGEDEEIARVVNDRRLAVNPGRALRPV